MLPQMVIDPLQEHLNRVKRLHDQDLAKGHGAVMRPYALARKYPQANREWVWQFVFPSAILSIDHQDGVIRRFHISPSPIQRALKQAANKAQIKKRVTSHAFRHSFATIWCFEERNTSVSFARGALDHLADGLRRFFPENR